MFFVGDQKGTCLEASVYFPHSDPLYESHICRLHNIDALVECSQKDTNDPDASFGKELLYAFISILKANYAHVTQLNLYDASYIPCNRAENDTLDLLTYNIALYGKSWYETVAGAYLTNPKHNQRYKQEIQKYINPTKKQELQFSILLTIINKHNDFAYQYIHNNQSTIANMYESSATFPAFFQKLKNVVPVKEKCKFFKGWLQAFLKDYVHIERDWTIPVENNAVIQNVLNVSKKRNMQQATRKRRRS